jgi:ribosomal protein S18 acetylase RimI-like enzyme
MVDVDFVLRRGGPGDIDALEPLWHALRDHQAALPELPPKRSPEASWERRSNQYREWLAGPDHSLVIAERDGRPIGYAVVSVGASGASTWDLGAVEAEVETLSVLASERGSGVGRALTDEAQRIAEEAGAGAVTVAVAHTNADAIRFYEREGFEPFYVLLLKRTRAA